MVSGRIKALLLLSWAVVRTLFVRFFSRRVDGVAAFRANYDIAGDRNSTIVFPIPIELVSLIPNISARYSGGDSGDGAPPVAPPVPMDTLPMESAPPGVLPEPIAESEAQFERARPDDTVLHDLNDEELKARRAERSRFMEGNILPPDEE